jgi:2-polyprenyl-6-hydroxyphenyl methylase/3-demethylubiquinone-9 3-methyltransferase
VQTKRERAAVNNDIYATLGERWYEAHDDPVALLRAESRLRNPWVEDRIAAHLGPGPRAVLDIGCGGGFLANHLAARGHRVTAIDEAKDALEVAALYDRTQTVRYQEADALSLPFGDGTFDVVCAMDFLEHVEDAERAVAEASRVLAPAGLFFFHTFNRNFLSWLVVIKGVEWFVENTPKGMHVLHLFLKPREVAAMCDRHRLDVVELRGSRPAVGAPLWQLVRSGKVPETFAFEFTRTTLLGYTGVARKRG